MQRIIFSIVVLLAGPVAGAAEPASFARLRPLVPQVIAAAKAFPGSQWEATNLVEPLLPGGHHREYASHAQGPKTFVDFDLGAALPVAAFEHIQRRSIDTVKTATLTFSDTPDFKTVLATVPVTHRAESSATTFAAFPPVTARYVRWQVTAIGPSPSPNVGGLHVGFYAVADREAEPRGITVDAQTVAVVRRSADQRRQPLTVTLESPYGTPVDALLRVAGQEPRPVSVTFGQQTVEYTLPLVEKETSLAVTLEYAGRPVVTRNVVLKPTRLATIYILPHSHTDIGYTEIQTDIEDKQVQNLLWGIEYARRTADYPPGARFVWNVEVLWAADLYLRRLGPEQRAAFAAALEKGQIALCGMYLNELTGLCRPEELLRLFRQATQLRQQFHTSIDAAMISDVPGYTWGTVTAMRQAGIKYFSVAPNYIDRIGDILVQWENKPFWWIGPAGQDRVLVWIPFKGYALSHAIRELTPAFVAQYMNDLDRHAYPYDIAYMRWAGHGDNAVPDPTICEFVKAWNAEHEWPRFVISDTGTPFRALEQRYGDKLPQARGDWTPYWEDGAGSSALETALNRASADRLAQAEALWAIARPETYPAADFTAAWRSVLLYSEHTWGAFCSVAEPNRRETREQWTIKQSYAVTADGQSRDMLSRAGSLRPGPAVDGAFDVWNTTAWPRTEVVTVPKYLAEKRQRVFDDQGHVVPSQRLRNGELVFLARNVPPLAGRRYRLKEGPAYVDRRATAKDLRLESGAVTVGLEPQRGDVVELRAAGLKANLVDTTADHALNEYLYLPGDKLAGLQRAAATKITVKEPGPLVAALLVESEAPGCFKLQREVRVVAGCDEVDLWNLVDKQRLAAANYCADDGKESVNFAFPFNVPQGRVRLDLPLGLMEPEKDQLASACKNWFTVGRWADVSNDDYGVTWVTLDAPLLQVGGITATLLNSQSNPAVWRKHVEPTQKLYSWAMNNHWHTNYRAYQEGPVWFRFTLRPHRKFSAAEAARLAIGRSQPLLAVAAVGDPPTAEPLLRVDRDDVLLSTVKPADDGPGWIVRLLNLGDADAPVTVHWSAGGARRMWLSDLSEAPGGEVRGPVSVPARGLVTLRAQR